MSSEQIHIHPTAIVSPTAVIGVGTTVGPYSIIGPHVVMGAGNKIGPHVVIEGRTKMGDGNTVYQFASVGAAPQDLKFRGEPSELHIGNENIIRECVTLQPGTEGGGMLTTIGDKNLFMANTHVGHDSRVGSRCVVANGSALAGHVTLGDGVIVGGLCGIHQFVRLGDIAMLGAGSMVSHDVPPYCIAQGDRAYLVGLNRVGLDRNGVSKEEYAVLRDVYRALFIPNSTNVKGMLFKERLAYARTLVGKSAKAAALMGFLEKSERGIMTQREGASEGD
jgi:UDP-N-acetylglucosamine acyltransferase